MDFNVTREQWIDRFVIRMSRLESGAGPADFATLASKLWPQRGQIDPEAAADGAAAERRTASRLEDTHRLDEEGRFERTERIPVERLTTDGEYVRDTDEWVARCVARVLALDPIIKADEARRSVADLSTLERWRVMKPEAAADQLYTPVKTRPA